MEHMKKCGIDVVTEARATKITDQAISIFNKRSNSTVEYPYGLIVWATGVTPGPLIQKLIHKIPPQSSFRSLKTDSKCQVIGAPGIYAVGDCADIDVQVEYEQKVCDIIDALKQKFPEGGNGEQLSMLANEVLVQELQSVIGGVVSAPGAKIADEIAQRFAEDSRSSQQNGTSFQGLTKDEAREIVKKHMDRQKLLPPTAQVAHQQGEYLAKLFNDPRVDPGNGTWTFDHGRSFEFKNLGQLVYVGGHMAALSVPAGKDIDVAWNGSLTNYIWHGAYFGMLESVAARFELFFDWTRSYVFGRSTALDAICTSDSTKHTDTLRRGGKIEESADINVQEKKSWWRIF